MPSKKTVQTKKYLLPLSWIYGLIVFMRNKLFDFKILKQKSYDVPIICIGNITVGGTGKTPHTEYLVEILKKEYKVAVLSRGYKRKTKGYLLSDANSTAKQIGDEPFQIKNKFPDILVAVDGKRTRGIEHLLALSKDKRPDVILLDDAFQHRYVKPSYSIVLTDYNRLVSYDKLLPVGRLREPLHHLSDANSIIITKCPKNINALEQRITIKDINPYPYQDLLFTRFKYAKPINVFDSNKLLDFDKKERVGILVVTGIANPKSLYRYLRYRASLFDSIEYPDHYLFKSKDIVQIQTKFEQLDKPFKVIIVTEKDAARLRFMDIPDELKSALYYIPIEVDFINEEEQVLFDNKIIDHVRNYRTNSTIHKVKD